MQGVSLSFYVYESQNHQNIALYQWLLEFAKKREISGGSAFRSIAGFGRTKALHEEHFFELGSDTPIEVRFFLEKEKAKKLIEDLKEENLNLFYVTSEIEHDFIQGN